MSDNKAAANLVPPCGRTHEDERRSKALAMVFERLLGRADELDAEEQQAAWRAEYEAKRRAAWQQYEQAEKQ